MLIATVVGFYLGVNGRVNALPTYVAALAFIPFILIRPTSLTSTNRVIALLTLLLFVYLSMSTFWSEGSSALARLKFFGEAYLTMVFIFGTAFMSTQFPGFLKWFLIMTVLSAAIACTYSIFLHFFLPDYQPLVENRLFSMGRLHNPVIAGLSYSVAAIISINLIFLPLGRSRILWVFCTLVLLAGIILTGTRSAIVGLLFAIPFSIILQGALSNRNRMLILIVLGCGSLMAALLSWQLGFWEGMVHRASSYRPEIWREVIASVLSSNLLIGNGIATSSKMVIDGFTFDHAHSIFFSTFYYGGLVGLAILLGIIASSFYALHKLEPNPVVILSISLLVFAIVALSFDGNSLIEKVNYLWIVFWLPISMVLLATDSNDAIDLG